MRRNILGVFGLLVLVVAVSNGSRSGATEKRTTQSDAATVKALEILRKHCLSCHGPGPAARAGLHVLDLSLLVEKRRVVTPGKAADSELIDLVQAGTMPPGNRPRLSTAEIQTLRQWIDTGALGLPIGDAYVIRQVLGDWKRPELDEKKKQTARYISLNHLLRTDPSAKRLNSLRADLEKALAAFAPKEEGPFLKPIDPQKSIFRIDLARLGWDRNPFNETGVADVAGKPKAKALKPSPVNLYDLLVLEYPYAYLSFPLADFKSLADYFKKTGLVRPVPYLRGDWLLAMLRDSPLRVEIAEVLSLSPRPRAAAADFWKARVTLQDAAAELGFEGGLPDLRKALSAVGLEDSEDVSRADWQKAFPRLVRQLKLGTPILPIDGLTFREHSPTTPYRFLMAMVHAKTGKGSERFKYGDEIFIELKSNKDVDFELVVTIPKGRHSTPLGTNALEASDKPSRWPKAKRGWMLLKVPGEFLVTAYVFPKKPGAPFPPSKWLRAPKQFEVVRDRIVHPVYELHEDGTGFKPPNVDNLLKVTRTFVSYDPNPK